MISFIQFTHLFLDKIFILIYDWPSMTYLQLIKLKHFFVYIIVVSKAIETALIKICACVI